MIVTYKNIIAESPPNSIIVTKRAGLVYIYLCLTFILEQCALYPHVGYEQTS